MAESGIKVVGLNEAIRALRAIGVPSAEIGAASQQAGELVASTARSLVPVRTGALRSTIKAKKIARKVVVNLQAKNIRPRPFFSNALARTRTQVYTLFFDNMEKLFQKYSNKKP